MTDPWIAQSTGQDNNSVTNGIGTVNAQPQEQQAETPLEFEDNFITAASSAPTNTQNSSSPARRVEHNSNEHQPLPDSDNYLRGLERKLQRIKKGTKLVDALAEKRDDCLRTLLQNGTNNDCTISNNNAALALDEPINNGELYRHLQPVQPISVGELVHIVKFDQLEQQQLEQEQDNQKQGEQLEEESKNQTTEENGSDDKRK